MRTRWLGGLFLFAACACTRSELTPRQPAATALDAAPDRARTRASDAAAPASVKRAVRPLALTAHAQPWPEAAARFRSGGTWLGADSAYSVDLGPTRVLWLFGDTFIDPEADGSRHNGPNYFVHNSVALQTGPNRECAHDLACSNLSFHVGPTHDAIPSSFFDDFDSAARFIWPLHGARLPDGELLLFRMQVVPTQGGLGFRVDTWDAVAVDDPAGPPEQWQPRTIAASQPSFGTLVGSSVMRFGPHLYAYAVRNDAPRHAVYLARWPLAALAGLPQGALSDPQWFTAAGWQVQSALLRQGTTPSPVFGDGQVELSIHYDAERERFIEIQMQGLFVSDPHTQLAMRTAAAPQGPWTALTAFYRPAERSLSDAHDLAAYAAKAHPEQRGADLVVTYAVNDLSHTPPPDSVYFPQPLKVFLGGPSVADGGVR